MNVYLRGVQDGARGVLGLLKQLLDCGFGWIEAIEVVEEWIKDIQRNAFNYASGELQTNESLHGGTYGQYGEA